MMLALTKILKTSKGSILVKQKQFTKTKTTQ